MFIKKSINSKQKSFKTQCYCASHKGNVREINEDYYLVKDDDSKPAIKFGKAYILCDGMGGHKTGEVAAKIAAEKFMEYYYSPENRGKNIPERIYESLIYANNEIIRYAQNKPEHKGMGTTIVGLIIIDNKGYVFNIGDSKLFHITKSNIYQLSEDHSLISEFKKHKLITEEQFRTSTYKNILTQSLGIETAITPFIKEIVVGANDGFILCSDGLNNYIPEEEVLYIYKENTLKDVPDELLKIALNRGGSDNITVIAIKPFVKNYIYKKILFSSVFLFLVAALFFSYKTYQGEFELTKFVNLPLDIFNNEKNNIVVQIINLDSYNIFIDNIPTELQRSLPWGEYEINVEKGDGDSERLKFSLNKDSRNPFLIVIYKGEVKVNCIKLKIISDVDVDLKVNEESDGFYLFKTSTDIYYLSLPISYNKDDINNLTLIGEAKVDETEITVSKTVEDKSEFEFIFKKLQIQIDEQKSGERDVINVTLLRGDKFDGDLMYKEILTTDKINLDFKNNREQQFSFSKENTSLIIKGKDENNYKYEIKWKEP